MTRQEFLKKLRETPRDWTVSFEGRIRMYPLGEHDGNGMCPITCFSGRPAWFFGEDAKKLKLGGRDANRIARAADGLPGYSKTLRRQLLEACGLSEAGTQGDS